MKILLFTFILLGLLSLYNLNDTGSQSSLKTEANTNNNNENTNTNTITNTDTNTNNDNTNTSNDSSNTNMSNTLSNIKEKILYYFDFSVEFVKTKVIELHKIITTKLNVQYPYDLIIFTLIGYLFSYFWGKLCSKKVNKNRIGLLIFVLLL